jgi:hypothetical protein
LAGPTLSLPAIVAAARRRTAELVVVHDGPSLTAHDLRRLLTKESPQVDAPALAVNPQPLGSELLGRLVKWGEQLGQPAAKPARPANFLSHLRSLAGA